MATPTVSESEYLKQEAAQARAEISNSLNRAREAITQKVDPRELTRRHPWIAVGSAAVAGFAAIVVAVPSKQERELRRLERLREAMSPPTPHKPSEANGDGSKPPEKHSLGGVILKELIQLVRPLLMAAVTAGIKAGANPPPAPPAPTDDAQSPDKSAEMG